MHAPRTRGALSPAAQLLRSSRVFSLPRALPRPQPGFNQFESDTGTLPYPIHQAIATPASSLSRGDWGLKRPLPLRATTRTSTPVFRVSSIDTIEHITEFESAGDHAQTLQKWQELNLSIHIGVESTTAIGSKPKRNAFESDYDNTTIEGSNAENSTSNLKRWKYRGPSVDTMSEKDFNRYVASVLKSERQDFNKFLRERIREKHIGEQRRYSRERGVAFDSALAEPNEQDYTDLHQTLRVEFEAHPENSELGRLIVDFLDLSPTADFSGSTSEGSAQTGRDFLEADESSARTTHPSAGLSYLRSHAYIENHPVLGPQAHHSPVEARVLRPRVMSGKTNPSAVLGVAGITAAESNSSHFRTPHKDAVDPTGLGRLNVNEKGGSKVWVEPEIGVITRDGRIKLTVKHADLIATDIRKGKTPQADVPSEKRPGFGRRHQTDRLDRPGGNHWARSRFGGGGVERSNASNKLFQGIKGFAQTSNN